MREHAGTSAQSGTCDRKKVSNAPSRALTWTSQSGGSRQAPGRTSKRIDAASRKDNDVAAGGGQRILDGREQEAVAGGGRR